MKVLNPIEIQEVAGGKNELTTLDFGAMIVGSLMGQCYYDIFLMKYGLSKSYLAFSFTPFAAGLGVFLSYQTTQFGIYLSDQAIQYYQTLGTKTA